MFEEFMREAEHIKEQILEYYSPLKIILFGSLAKKHIKISSDIDICVVIETENKSALVKEMYSKIDSSKPFDLVIYTPEEWQEYKDNTMSFVHCICKEGEVIYGG